MHKLHNHLVQAQYIFSSLPCLLRCTNAFDVDQLRLSLSHMLRQILYAPGGVFTSCSLPPLLCRVKRQLSALRGGRWRPGGTLWLPGLR